MSVTDVTSAEEPEQLHLPLIVNDGQDLGQFCVSRVQVLNWGSYAGLQTMPVARKGTAILGPSGRGKSTLLDAMASVILPNPQEFNQAARDDHGKKRERTVYSYARGQTDQRQDANRRSATTNYLRPPGGPAFPSGTAITWDTGTGRRVTAFRVAWVTPDVDGPEAINNATTYGFVNDVFDLAALNGIKPARVGSSPLSKTSLAPLVDLERGDVVDASQGRVHAKMRSVMGMGSNDESQHQAMQLLRRAQASKGIFSINGLFTELVLTEPLAIARWDQALQAYREASALYDEFEAARVRQTTLEPLPGLADKYRAAGADYSAKNRLLIPSDETQTPRVDVWHATRVADWVERLVQDNRLDRATVKAELAKATRRAEDAEVREREARDLVTAAGGQKAKLIEAWLEPARADLERAEAARRRFGQDLAPLDLSLPESEADHAVLMAILEEQLVQAGARLKLADGAASKAEGIHWGAKERVADLKAEITGVKQRRSNVDPDAVERRVRIAEGTGIDASRLPYAGELMRVKAADKRWEKAVTGLLRSTAMTMLVAERDFATVRRFVHDNDMRGSITLAPVPAAAATLEPEADTIPGLLEFDRHDYSDWLRAELIRTQNYWCVERETDLDRPRPAHTRGAVTPAGMRTAGGNRVTKDDRTPRYTWIGWDNRALIHDLEDELQAAQRAEVSARDRAVEAGADRTAAWKHQESLKTLLKDLVWDAIDSFSRARRVEDLDQQLKDADSPELTRLKAAEKTQRDAAVRAAADVTKLSERLGELNATWAELETAKDKATDVIDGQEPLDNDELYALAQLPFEEPSSVSGIDRSRRAAHQLLDDQIAAHLKDRQMFEGRIEDRLFAYRNLNTRTARETDGTIDSLPAVLAIYQQLIRDDLPRAKSAWLAKVDEELNEQLRKLVVQIDDDDRAIRRGLDPINTVLENVRFREHSTLSIDPIEHVSPDLRDFRSVVTKYTANSVGLDVEKDSEQVQRSFVTLRKQLARLEDLSKAGEAWRRRVFDAREHVEFRAIESRPDGVKIIHEGVSGMSGGEGQELIAFILGAALRFRLGEGKDGPPRYGSVILDEGFVKADSDYTGRALAALRALGFQLIVGAPREKATAFEGHVDSVAYINSDPANREHVRIFPMSIREALAQTGSQAN